MRKPRLGIIASCIFVVALTGAALADDSRSNSDRLDRVERDLNQLQRQVYRNEVGGPAPSVPDGGGAATGGGTLDVQIRMDQIEDQMRKLTGQLEELQFTLSQQSGRLDKMQSDNEVRFQQLEGGGASAAAPSLADAGPGGSGSAPTAAPAASRGAGNMDEPAPRAGSLAAPDGGATGLPDGSIQTQYSYAFGLLRQHDYKGSEAAFKAFLQRHPTDPLSSNAQYWLGGIYMERKDYKSAAAAFADGYQKAPQGPKAPENLMNLGEALGNQNRKQEACFSFARLERDFPTVAPRIRDRVVHDKQQFGC